jgi:hypothetical protein
MIGYDLGDDLLPISVSADSQAMAGWRAADAGQPHIIAMK